MATVAPRCTLPFTLGTDAMGQGSFPLLDVLLSIDKGATWTQIGTAGDRPRDYSVQRGRNADLDTVEPATCTIMLENLDRVLDPTVANLKPGRDRVWLRADFNGTQTTRFVGTVESYEQQWPGSGKDGVTVVRAVDDFALLAREKLPNFDPPRDTYADMIQSDQPANYWRFSDFNNLSGEPGPSWTVGSSGGYGVANATAIVGDYFGSAEDGTSGCLAMQGTGAAITTDEVAAFDTLAGSVMTCEFWFRYTAVPGSNFQFLCGRMNAAGSARNFVFNLTTGGVVQFQPVNTVPTSFLASSGALSVNTWYHIAGVVTGSNTVLYVNGVAVDTQSWSGTLVTNNGNLSTTVPPIIQNTQSMTFNMDELAFYPRDIGATRIAAHYTGGAARGFHHGQDTFNRMHAVLDATELGSTDYRIPRLIYPGLGGIGLTPRLMVGAFMHGQAPLEELRKAERTELADGVLFVTRDGVLKFLPRTHRFVSPYDTVQITFDETTAYKYRDLATDYSNSFLVNEWSGSTPHGQLQTSSDSASIVEHGRFSNSTGEIALTTNADVTSILDALVAKTKAAFHRIVSITLDTSDPDRAAALLNLDVGDRVRVLWTPPAGSPRIDQTSFVQSIRESGNRDSPVWTFTLGITPL